MGSSEAASKVDIHHRYPRYIGVLGTLSTIYRIDDAIFGILKQAPRSLLDKRGRLDLAIGFKTRWSAT